MTSGTIVKGVEQVSISIRRLMLIAVLGTLLAVSFLWLGGEGAAETSWLEELGSYVGPYAG
jgi:hypothetical protein